MSERKMKGWYKKAVGYREPGQRVLPPHERLEALRAKLGKLEEIKREEKRELNSCQDPMRALMLRKVIASVQKDIDLIQARLNDLLADMGQDE